MNLTTPFLNLMGFDSFKDFLGINFQLKFLFLVSFPVGSFLGLIETWTGISIYLWVFLTLASIFDIAFGIIANILILKSPFESGKFFRGIFKSFIVLFIIVITNTLKMGIEESKISPDFLKLVFEYIGSTIHYSFVILIALYLLTGISENGAKIGIPVFKSLSNILKIKIKKVENLADKD